MHRLKRKYYAYFAPVKLSRLLYREVFGINPNLNNPTTFNEKLLWLKHFSDTSRWSLLADKYRVREYVRECGLGWMLNELYGVWESPSEIDLITENQGGGNLPESAVFKTNNGCGDVLVVRDLAHADWKVLRKKMRRSLRIHFGRKTAEHHYLAIKPCIIAEKYLPFDPQLSCSLVDYKFFCFGGEPRYCMVCYNRITHHNVKTGLYDARTWQPLTHYVTGKYFDPEQPDFPKPESLEIMLDAARRLSSGFPQVRIDLYEIAGKPVFGEMTFTSAAGLDTGFTEEFQRIMGSQIQLPNAVGK